MKIALVTRQPVPATRTLGRCLDDETAHVDGLGRALAALGHDVVIYARKDAADQPRRRRLAPRLTAEFIAAGPHARVPAEQLPSLAKDIAGHLATSWQQSQPDIVHAFHWTNALAALSAAREHPVPVAATFGSLGSAERHHRVGGEPSAARLRLEACVARTVSAVLATTSDEAAELARLGTPTAHISLAPCGVDATTFSPVRATAKRKGRTRLVAVGSLAEQRGLGSVLRCLAELSNSELVIAGGPPADDLDADPGYRILAKLAAEIGVADRVRFVGRVTENELAVLLRSANLLVNGTSYEPYGTTAIRAMACGVPIVATAVGSYRDVVVDGATGLLVPPWHPDLLGLQIRELLTNPMRLSAFGIAAADRARSRYPWSRIATETAAAYTRAALRSRSEGGLAPMAAAPWTAARAA